MEDFRIIFLSFMVVAILLTLAMLKYDLNWKKRNSWWRQDDEEMRLSPAEQAYRRNERQKLNNALMMWFASLFMVLGTMFVTLFAYTNGGMSGIGRGWFYAVPFICAVLFAFSSIQRRK